MSTSRKQARAAPFARTRSLLFDDEAPPGKVKDGSIIQRFEATPPPRTQEDIVCPHFWELKWATGCPFSCAWCYLQGTFRFLPYRTRPKLKPPDKIAQHLLEFWATARSPEMLNAGELSDALLGERDSFSLVRFLSDLLPDAGPHKVLLVTKSDWIENLLQVRRPDLFVVSFSVNPSHIAERWEKGAPSPTARLDAAAELAKAGYEVRLRVDPMVPVDDWQVQYATLFEEIFCRFRPSRLTLGSLRGLQSTVNNARDRSWTVFLSETSRWGKRVAEALRVRMFRFALGLLNRDFAFREVALCKEPVAVWESLGLDWHDPPCNCTW